MNIRASRVRTAAAVVAETIARHSMIGAGERVLVGFSGGADSTALAVLLEALGYEIVLGHIDHGLRATSGRDAVACREMAGKLDLPMVERRVIVTRPTEAGARDARYQALNELAQETGASKIATGHTLDDQAETVLMRLARGGFAKGIPYVRGNVIRPILDLRRVDTESVCLVKGMHFLVDESNHEDRFTRNLIRRDVLPKFPDDTVVALASLGRIAQGRTKEFAEKLESVASSAVHLDQGEAWIDRRSLDGLDDPSGRALIRSTLERLGMHPTTRLVRDIHEKVARTTGASLDLPLGRIARCEPERVVISSGESNRSSPSRAEIRVPGVTVLPQWGIELEAIVGDSTLVEQIVGTAAAFDFDSTGTDLSIRSRTEGDRFHPAGMHGTKKVQDFFVDQKIPRAERDFVPLIIKEEEIVWIVGHRSDGRFTVSPGTKRVLLLIVRDLEEQ